MDFELFSWDTADHSGPGATRSTLHLTHLDFELLLRDAADHSGPGAHVPACKPSLVFSSLNFVLTFHFVAMVIFFTFGCIGQKVNVDVIFCFVISGSALDQSKWFYHRLRYVTFFEIDRLPYLGNKMMTSFPLRLSTNQKREKYHVTTYRPIRFQGVCMQINCEKVTYLSRGYYSRFNPRLALLIGFPGTGARRLFEMGVLNRDYVS